MNLFIAVVMNNLEAAKEAQNPEVALLEWGQQLREDLLRLERELRMSTRERAISEAADERVSGRSSSSDPSELEGRQEGSFREGREHASKTAE